MLILFKSDIFFSVTKFKLINNNNKILIEKKPIKEYCLLNKHIYLTSILNYRFNKICSHI